ncbi:STAS domain-containing protein, partial [Kitasatospora sp. NPDC002227]|uniref:STAS domain-containing protein n=1 Tax=Kitasatospora sp. NPDC002227 TaxID=3154773 RepID=UPI00331A4B16
PRRSRGPASHSPPPRPWCEGAAVSMQWDLDQAGQVGILRLSGFLSERTTHRLHGAVEWARARCPDGVVVDLSALTGWNQHGEAGIVAAAERLGQGPTRLVVCGLRERPAPALLAAVTAGVLVVQPDADAALGALGRT